MYVVSLKFVVITVNKKITLLCHILDFGMNITSQLLTEIFGKNIKFLREKIKISQEKLAEKMDVSKNTISDIENGKKFVHAKTLAKLANALNTEVYELFKPEGAIPDNPVDLLYKFKEHAKEALDNLGNEYMGDSKQRKNPKRTKT